MVQQDDVNIVQRRQQTGDQAAETDGISSQATSVDTKTARSPKPAYIKTSTVATAILSPALATSLVLIFGGCCSNVYALESIVSLAPATGTVITFLQFLLTSLYTLPSQLTTSPRRKENTSSLFPRLRTRIIPLHKWFIYTAFFVTINILNNAAFGYRISVPLHIILRSASPVTTMLVGYVLGGRRYTARQVFAVVLLFVGVVLAALSDANTKSLKKLAQKVEQEPFVEAKLDVVKSSIASADAMDQLPGFVFLFSALILAALMGIYTDKIYDEHGRSIEVTDENLFYSHTLSLPWFAIQAHRLKSEFTSLVTGAAATNSTNLATSMVQSLFLHFPKLKLLLPSYFQAFLEPPSLRVFSLLLINALTQIVCITGVNQLSTETTSLTVTIVLNIRKLVSLLISIWLFGNTLSAGVVIGAIMVFVGGGLYGLSGAKKKKA